MESKLKVGNMFVTALSFMLCSLECLGEDYYYTPYNVTRSTLSGIAAYRSSLTLDWLAAEDTRQRELAAAFETEAAPAKVVSTDCIAFPRPAPGKIGKLMLELLKNLEGDDGTLIPELIQVLIRTKLLVDTSILESEPDLESLVETPGVMMGEPHTTFPRILAIVWMLVTDASTTRKFGWCPVKKVNQYLTISRPSEIAKQMRALEMVVARARFIMEEFIQNVTPLNMYRKKSTRRAKSLHEAPATRGHAMKPRAHEKWPSSTTDLDALDPEFFLEDRWTYRNAKRPADEGSSCLQTHPTNRDIIKRFHAILPFFDKDHSNTEFLRKFRASVYAMSEGEDMLDREAAFYAAVFTPLVFLQNYRDSWCLLQRFHRALRLYQISHPTEKRSALKLLQNFRAVNHKVRMFVWELPSPTSSRTTTEEQDFGSEEIHDTKDIRYLKELIKNLG